MHGHDYHKKCPLGIPLHLEYADDINFFTKPDTDLERIKAITRETLEKYGLTINSEKTEVAIYDGQSNLQKVKKLGTILDGKNGMKQGNSCRRSQCQNIDRFGKTSLYQLSAK